MRVIPITQILLMLVAVAIQVGQAMTPNPLLAHDPHSNEAPRFRRSLSHCTRRGAKVCWEPNAGIQHPNGLATFLFHALEKCLNKHERAVPDQCMNRHGAASRGSCGCY